VEFRYPAVSIFSHSSRDPKILLSVAITACETTLLILLAVTIAGNNGNQFFPGPPLAPGAPENGALIKNFTFNAYNSEGRAQHSPFVVYRAIDPSSPVLLGSLINNTPLKEVRVVAVLHSNGTAAGTGKSKEHQTFGGHALILCCSWLFLFSCKRTYFQYRYYCWSNVCR
jgi:hypothetical protein